jgi:hypothetical protein
MTRTLLGLALLSGVGCVHVQPVGPLADAMGLPANPPPPGAKAAAAAGPAPEPVIREAPKPTPPALYVTPGEVSKESDAAAEKRLQQELDTDRRGMEAMPRYAEVSAPGR